MSPAGNHVRAMVSAAEAGSGSVVTLTQDSATPTSATPALVGDPGHVLGYSCSALTGSLLRLVINFTLPTRGA